MFFRLAAAPEPFTDTVGFIMCELTVAPTVMTEGAVPGDSMVLK